MRAGDSDSSPPIQFPAAGVDPRGARKVRSMSSAAGIKTSWQVVQGLIRKELLLPLNSAFKAPTGGSAVIPHHGPGSNTQLIGLLDLMRSQQHRATLA